MSRKIVFLTARIRANCDIIRFVSLILVFRNSTASSSSPIPSSPGFSPGFSPTPDDTFAAVRERIVNAITPESQANKRVGFHIADLNNSKTNVVICYVSMW